MVVWVGRLSANCKHVPRIIVAVAPIDHLVLDLREVVVGPVPGITVVEESAALGAIRVGKIASGESNDHCPHE